ncbi:MAG TPA: phosphate acyltransferase PlsX [Coriobacteriia bacterium]|nr:phosphate acyltransferase PlsX [Coriobacteriia bacterium]
MEKPVTIAVDVMGGDNAPEVVLEGVDLVVEADSLLRVVLTGPEEVIRPAAEKRPDRIEAVATTQVIAMDEHPANAVREKKDSSIVVGCNLVKEGRAQGFFSAGSTGACMAAATLYIGRIKGVARPAIASVIPSPIAPVVLTDIGANADVKPEYLVQFAQMAGIYAQKILDVGHPRIGLLNIGEEETKGSMLIQEAYGLLKEKVSGFVGNAEGNDILQGKFDVIVTDGFTGNVALKTIEGAAETLFAELKKILSASLGSKIGASLIMPGLRQLKKNLSADEIGGAPLLGLKGGCIIGHGSSNAKAISNGIAATALYVREDVTQVIAEAVS